MSKSIVVAACLAGLLAGCINSIHEHVDPHSQHARLQADMSALRKSHDLVTVGAALIHNAEVVWTGYFGEQEPGAKANKNTQFNVGSITKTVAAETVLRLVGDGTLELDSPMAPEWVDPDLQADPRHRQLTPRMVLTHTTGFPNWRFFTPGGKLSFLADPGTAFTYSGEGFEYLATFVETRTGQDFADLVQSIVLEPIGISNAAYRIEQSNFQNIAQTRGEDGKFPGHYCYPQNNYCRSAGSSTPADDLVITVEDYAAFLISVMKSEGYGDTIAADRDTVHSSKGAHAVVDCQQLDSGLCPLAQGYGLGWEILDYGDRKIVAHGGSDWHELAIAYFETDRLDGVIIFLNAPNQNALAAMPEALKILDADSPFIGMYQRWHTASSQAD